MLTAGFADHTEELEEIEDLFADAVRLATKIGDLGTARAIAGHAASPRRCNRRSRTGRRTRSIAAACWTMMPPGCSAPRSDMATPPGRCSARRHWRPPLETSFALATATRHGPRSPAPWRSIPRLAPQRTSPGCRLRSKRPPQSSQVAAGQIHIFHRGPRDLPGVVGESRDRVRALAVAPPPPTSTGHALAPAAGCGSARTVTAVCRSSTRRILPLGVDG